MKNGKQTTPYEKLYPEKFQPADFLNEETYRHTRAPVRFALTLIPEAYTSEVFFALEQERVFANSWVAVGCTSQVQAAGDVLVTQVAGQSIVLTRNKAGQLRGFYNVCRHRGALLVDPGCSRLPGKRFRCPYHSWAYDLDGRCIGTPLFEGSDIPEDQRGVFDMGAVDQFDRSDYPLFPVHVESWGFLLFVNLAKEPDPLSRQLGDLPERFSNYRLDEWVVARQKTFLFEANYKLVGENFIEYYHLPWVHPELIKVSRMEDHYRWQGPGMYTGMTTWPISQNSEAGGWLGLPPLSGLGGTNQESARFIWLFPNVAINVMPNHAFIMITHPDRPTRTSEQTYLLCHPESMESPGAQTELDQLVEFWTLVNEQDIEIVEKVQAGLSLKPYRGGRMCYHFEEPIHRYQNMIIDKMVGRDRIPPGDAREQVPMFGGSQAPGPLLRGIDHVQLAMPPGGEAEARRYYRDLLGLREVPKPEALAARGGCWFEGKGIAVHMGVQQAFQAARKAHPAFRVADLAGLADRLSLAGFEVEYDRNLPGIDRFYSADPFGNRIEFMQDLRRQSGA